jgi:Ca2+-binding RTX toxin-like protein
VDGGSGRDRLFGRGGDDLIDARDTERDVVYCGTGRDTVRADRGDLLRGCERVFRR